MKRLKTILLVMLTAEGMHAQQIAGGGWHSAAVCNASFAMAWGRNDYGQLGTQPVNSDKNVPASVIASVIDVSLGNSFSLYLKSNGTVWNCGRNNAGQLGDGTNFPKSLPAQITSLTGIIAISAGEEHSLFLKNDGTVWACGRNDHGQLGDSTIMDKYTPVKVKGVSGITAVSAGNLHSLFLKNDGTVWGCGNNGMGELGTGDNQDKIKPVQSPSLTGIAKISAGKRYFSLFLKGDSTVWATGDNVAGQLGDGTVVQKWSPVQVSLVSGVTDIATGWQHSLFRKIDGSVWACGSNYWGQLGIGTVDPNPHSTPVQIASLSGIKSIGAGDHHSLFVKSSHDAWACGDNGNGQLGDESYTSRTSAAQIHNFCLVGSVQEIGTNTVRLYPNPGIGLFVFESDADISRIDLFDQLGAKVFSTEPGTDTATIDIRSFPKGIYFYRLTLMHKGVVMGKMISN